MYSCVSSVVWSGAWLWCGCGSAAHSRINGPPLDVQIGFRSQNLKPHHASTIIPTRTREWQHQHLALCGVAMVNRCGFRLQVDATRRRGRGSRSQSAADSFRFILPSVRPPSPAPLHRIHMLRQPLVHLRTRLTAARSSAAIALQRSSSGAVASSSAAAALLALPLAVGQSPPTQRSITMRVLLTPPGGTHVLAEPCRKPASNHSPPRPLPLLILCCCFPLSAVTARPLPSSSQHNERRRR